LVVLYSITRWPIESLRADERVICAGMNSAQMISAVLSVLGLVVLLSPRFSFSAAVDRRRSMTTILDERLASTASEPGSG
jgi:prolipoprotein diacylglyceryltransferase